METKICTKCKDDKPLDKFCKNKNRRDGYNYLCKLCDKEKVSEFIKNNPGYYKKSNKKFKENNPNYQKEWSINNPNYMKDYRNNNPNLQNNYLKKRRGEDELFRLRGNIRTLLYKTVKCLLTKNQKIKSVEILGCTFNEFKQHIELLWKPWMNWDNYGNPKDGILEFNKTWDLDHIIPISSANTEEDVIRLNHYTNFQPLCSKVNREIKRNNIN